MEQDTSLSNNTSINSIGFIKNAVTTIIYDYGTMFYRIKKQIRYEKTIINIILSVAFNSGTRETI